MKTTEEIKARKERDIKFIVSAVTSELHDLAFLKYFSIWEENGGMQWFFQECVDITHLLMLTQGSPYMKWLDVWSKSDSNVIGFMDVTGETCFDWYHMDEARKVFEDRWEKDDDITDQYRERIARMLGDFESEDEQQRLLDKSLVEAKRNKNVLKARKKQEELDNIVSMLKEIRVDGEGMEYILNTVGMREQMITQLTH